MNAARAIVFAAVLLARVPSAAAADALSLDVNVSPRTVAVGETFTVEVRAVAQVDGNIEVDVPAVAGLTELRRSQSESTSFAWTSQGQSIRRERTLRIDYEANEPGQVRLDAISARVGENRVQAAPVIVEVIARDAVPARPATPGNVAPPAPDEGQLFLRYRTDKAQAYIGEQILLDLDIFTNGNFNLEEMRPPPTLDGFWREIVDQPQRLDPRVEVVGGRQFRAYRLWRVALFPLQAGERTVPGDAMTFSANRTFFSVGERFRRAPPAIKLEILPLPTEGRPRDFASTNVGQYQLVAKLDSEQAPAGKAVVLTLALSGFGNVKNARLPAVEKLEGFRVFPATVRDHVDVSATGISGRKESEQILMPLRGGRLEIPPFEMVVFNPATRTYERVATHSLRVVVEGDPSAVAPGTDPPGTAADPGLTADPGAGPNVARSTLRPLRFRSDLEERKPPLGARAAFVLLLIAPPFLFGAALLAEAMIARMRKETPASKRKRAARHAHGRLQVAEEAAHAGDALRAYAEISEAITAFASDKSGVALRGLTMDDARQALADRGAPDDLIERMVTELEHCDFARFAPGGQDAAAVSGALERAGEILSAIEAWRVREVA